ncbi:MAG: glycosyltransferase family 2 protein [Bacteroidota bacterium]
MANPNQPTISLGIPTYNGAKRISSAIESIYRQGYENLEIIISDNASTDNAAEVIQEFADKDSRIRFFQQPTNLGLMPNFDFVLQQASSDYFMWVADDDELVPDVLSRYVEFLESNPDYSLVSGMINYWKGDVLMRCEKEMSTEQTSPVSRLVNYYGKVKDGALTYGLMRTEAAKAIPVQTILGPDWHHVAGLAFLGKIKQLDFVGYSKQLGGNSVNFVNYARNFGEHWFWGKAPYMKIAKDAFSEVLYRTPAYRKMNVVTRLYAATASSFGVLIHFYGKRYPKILAGKLLRAFNITTPNERKRMRNQPKKGQVSFSE